MSEALVLDGTFELVDITTLQEHPENPRIGDVASIMESIRANGFFLACGCQTSTRRIIIGNHRYKAAMKLGLKEIPVIWHDVDDASALRILLADNKTADEATYNQERLGAILSSLSQATGTLQGTGYKEGDLEDILDRLKFREARSGDIGGPSVPKVPEVTAEPGDWWGLGYHTLIVGENDLAAADAILAAWNKEPGHDGAKIVSRKEKGKVHVGRTGPVEAGEYEPGGSFGPGSPALGGAFSDSGGMEADQLSTPKVAGPASEA